MSPSSSIEADLRAWAYSEELEPQEDFDLMITGCGHERLFLEWAADEACPKAEYFLGCLYLFVGDAVRTGYKTSSRAEVEGLLGLAEGGACESLHEWVDRSRRLIADPESFDYDLWCAGGYAREGHR